MQRFDELRDEKPDRFDICVMMETGYEGAKFFGWMEDKYVNLDALTLQCVMLEMKLIPW